MVMGAEDYWDVTTISGQLDGAITQLTEIINNIQNGTNVKLDTANTKLDTIIAGQGVDLGAKVDAVNTKLDTLNNNITNNTNVKLDTLATKTDAITTHLNTVTDGKLDTLGTKVDAVATQISGGTNPKLDTAISNLVSVVSNLATEITALGTILTELELHTGYLSQIAGSSFTEGDMTLTVSGAMLLSARANRSIGTVKNNGGNTMYLSAVDISGTDLGYLPVGSTTNWSSPNPLYGHAVGGNTSIHWTDSI